MVDAFYYTDVGSLAEYFGRTRLPDGAADDYVLEYLLCMLDSGQMVLSKMLPPYCLYLKTITPVRGQRGLNPCPLVVIRNATGNGDPTQIRLLVRKPEPAKPPVPIRVPLHRWPEDEDEPPPTPAPPSIRSAPDGKPESPEPDSDEPSKPEAEPAKPVPVKAQRQAQVAKRKTRRKAQKDRRIAAAAMWAKGKPDLGYAEVREKPPSKKVDFYTECKAEVANLTYNEFKAGVKIERDRRRVKLKAAVRKS